MNSVFKSETYRLFHSTEVRIMTIALVLLELAGIAVNYFLNKLSIVKEAAASAGNIHPGFFDGIAGIPNQTAFRLLFIIIVAGLITRLYSSGVSKQLVSCGIPRFQVILGQFLSFTAVFSVVALIVALAGGISRLIQGGSFGMTEGSMARLPLSIAAMILVIACLTALFLTVSHLTGSMSPAIVLGLLLQIGAPSLLMGIYFLTDYDFIYEYFVTTVMKSAVDLTITIPEQLKFIGVLFIYTVLFFVLCQIVFKQKEIK